MGIPIKWYIFEYKNKEIINELFTYPNIVKDNGTIFIFFCKKTNILSENTRTKYNKTRKPTNLLEGKQVYT